MDTISLNCLLKRNKYTRKYFKGVYALDKLPKIVKQPSLVICNTDKSSENGVHWVAIFIPPKNAKKMSSEFFDTFGRQPTKPNFINYLTSNKIRSIIYNPIQVQANTSSSCGKFCCLYLLHKSQNKSMKSFIELFSENLPQNEILVREMFKKSFKTLKCKNYN